MLGYARLLVVLSAPVSAQELLYEVRGQGAYLAPLGDLDGDGALDVVTERRVGLSGRSGAILFSYGPVAATFGSQDHALSLGDLDGDGRAEVVLGTSLYSGASLLASPAVLPASLADFLAPSGNLGVLGSLAALADRNGDGIPEVLAGWPDVEVFRCPSDSIRIIQGATGGAYRIYSGLDGSVLQEVIDSVVGNDFGGLVAALSDVDGDGKDEYAIGTRSGSGPILCEFSGADRLQVRSGATDAVLWEITGAPRSVERVGDVDHDGHGDLALAYPTGERVEVRSSRDGRLLWVRQDPAPAALNFYGHTLVGAGNLFGAGRPSLILSVPQPVVAPLGFPGDSYSAGPGLVWIESLGSRRQSARLTGRFVGEEFGCDIEWLGDVNRDGRPELAVGVANAVGGPSVRVVSLALAPEASGATRIPGVPTRVP